MTFQALPGFRDFFPDDLAFRAHILAAWRRVAARYGFEEYDGPPLEPVELYAAKSGDELVGQLFDFVDKGDRHVTLRPEMTPTFARMVAARANGLPKPIRWFSIPQLFRYEKQQRGRLREHFQLNCDLVGEAGPAADAEVIALAVDMLRELGLTSEDFSVRVSDRRLLTTVLDALQVPPAAHSAAYQVLDKLGRAEEAAQRAAFAAAGGPPAALALLTGPLREATTWDALVAAARATPALATALADGAPLQETLAALDAMGLADYVVVDLSIVRGIAYYTGTVFELFDRRRTLRAICGGGRYDSLLATLGGVDLPALGFGMGDVVLAELLSERGLRPTREARVEVFVAGVTPEDRALVLALVHQLRDAGLRTEYALGTSSLGKQLKQAGARGAVLVVVVGPDDRERGEVQLRDFRDKTQQAVPRDTLVARCRQALTSTG
jgi:histidyl-tRNA synthetase